MRVGRNQPCPCGSARKYKQCCEPLDQEVGLVFRIATGDFPGRPTPGEIARAAGGQPWQADVIRSLGPGGSVAGPPGTAGIAVVMGGGHLLCVEALDRAPDTADRAAAVLDRAVRIAERKAGVRPSALLVRSEPVAARLRACDALTGLPITAAELSELEAFADGALEALVGNTPEMPASEVHDTWRQWGWPPGTVAELFRAAAAFWRAAPWRVVDNAHVLTVRGPSGRAWTASVLGNGGMEFGLALYHDLDDLLRQFETETPAEAMAALRAPVLSLTFAGRAELERRTVKEILAAGWEIADRDAYPELVVLNPPPDGVSFEWASELTGALWSVSRFVELHRAIFQGEVAPDGPVRWVDPATGIEVGHKGPIELGDVGLWDPPDTLTTALPVGPASDPEAALVQRDPDALLTQAAPLVKRFRSRLEQEGVAPPDVQRCVRHVCWLLDGLCGGRGVPLAACTELDLRVVLYDWLPRKSEASESEGQHILASLVRFFAHLADREGLTFPWLDAILSDWEAFDIRLASAPHGPWWQQGVADWRAEVYEDLAARVLLPDMGMAGGGEWGVAMGPVEAALRRELERRWLLWRDETLVGGMSEPQAVAEQLVAQQREWERAGHPRHHGRSPIEAVAREREAAASRFAR